jgi:hypothetical protein
MGALDLPPAIVPVGLSSLLGVVVAALLIRWDRHR